MRVRMHCVFHATSRDGGQPASHTLDVITSTLAEAEELMLTHLDEVYPPEDYMRRGMLFSGSCTMED